LKKVEKVGVFEKENPPDRHQEDAAPPGSLFDRDRVWLRRDAAAMICLSRENTRLDFGDRVHETVGVMPPWHFQRSKYRIAESVEVIKRNVIVTLHFGHTE
jgi:hypothetical protein